MSEAADHVEIIKVAHYVPLTVEMAADAAGARSIVDEMFDRWANPWRYLDRNPLPTFDLFPALSRVGAWLHRITHRRHDEDDW